MSNQVKGKSASKIVAVAATILLAGAVALGLYLAVGEGGGAAGGDRAARALPKDTTLLVWTCAIDELVTIAAEAGLEGRALAAAEPEFDAVAKKLGANPLTAEGLRALGVDTSASLALSLAPAQDVGFLATVNVPLADGKSAVETAKEIIGRL